MDLGRFFEREGMDVYAVLPVSDCSAPEGFHPRDMLPSARAIIIFGKEVPPEVYTLGSREKTQKIHEVINRLDRTASRLSQKCILQGYASVPVPSFFPVRIHGGKAKGALSLKHCAQEAKIGVIGLNTLLISQDHGNCLALGAVVTEMILGRIRPAERHVSCFNCEKCIKSCPNGALSRNGVDFPRCENVSHAVLRLLRPLFNLLLNAIPGLLQHFINKKAWNAEMVCSRCLTVCPHFKKRAPQDE